MSFVHHHHHRRLYKLSRSSTALPSSIESPLTRQLVHIFRTTNLILPTYFPDTLIASCEDCNADEGDEEREGGADVPPVENYAEVCGVPCEEHLGERY